MNSDVSPKQLKDLRNEFETYLRNSHPHWSSVTVNTVKCDAFFALNNHVVDDFWGSFVSEDSMLAVRDKIETLLLKRNKPASALERANGYLSALRHLKAFLDRKNQEHVNYCREEKTVKRDLTRGFEMGIDKQKDITCEIYNSETFNDDTPPIEQPSFKLKLRDVLADQLFYNSYDKTEEIHKSVLTVPTRNTFLGWLSEDNSITYTPKEIVDCMDRISKYALQNKISVDLWSITDPSVFETVYNKILKTKHLQITKIFTYKMFFVAGQLYLKFLGINKITPDLLDHEELIIDSDSLGAVRNDFIEWLSKSTSLKNSPEEIVKCIDEISDYAIDKKISLNKLWSITEPSVFETTYRTLLKTKDLQITKINSYKLFFVAGQLYHTYLKEKPFTKDLFVNVTEQVSINKELQTNVVYEDINPDDFIEWYITNPKSNDKLYLEKTAREYVKHLESSPNKLKLWLPMKNRNVFSCHKSSELEELWEKFKSASNYRMINNETRGAFSAGLTCLTLYLEHLEQVEECPKDGSLNNEIPNLTQEGLEPDILTMIKSVLANHFPNGFRIGSPIDMIRFRNFAAEHYVKDISLTDEEINNSIDQFGTLFEGKLYVVCEEAMNKLKEMIYNEVKNGAKVFYYTSIYARNEIWLNKERIISMEMLKEVLGKIHPEFLHKTNYFLSNNDNSSELMILKCEIMRVWNKDTILNYDQISERLPNIPKDKIMHALNQDGDFIWNSTEVYTHIGMFDILDEERANILDYVATQCQKHGYVSISDVPLGEITERNFELTQTAIQTAVFTIVLKDKYKKQGKIITPNDYELDALTIMKEHCRKIEKCSLQDLLDYERKLTGENHRWIPLEAGYAELVRISDDNFVADRYVDFDTCAIDEAIEIFVTGNYLPLKCVTTFATFPHCGQVWNLFLLESYCRRFSQRFRFDVLAVNSRNAGAIVRKNCQLAYTEIMEDAVALSNVKLEKADVVEFLFSNGYIGKRSYSKTDELIEHAKKIRESGN